MILKRLLSESLMVYIAQQSGGTTGTTYNGVTPASSTTATPMLQGAAASGKGIDISGYNRALVALQLGVSAATGNLKFFVSAGSVKADDVSMTELTGSEVVFDATEDSGYFLTELDLRGAKTAVPSAASGADNSKTWLWCVLTQDGTTSSVIVMLGDPEYEPAVDSAPTPVRTLVASYWPSTIAP